MVLRCANCGGVLEYSAELNKMVCSFCGNSYTIDELNQKALDYYRHLTYSKHFCFQRWGLFFSLYKYEDFKYMMENFLILNMPTIARIAFKIMKAKEAREANKAKG